MRPLEGKLEDQAAVEPLRVGEGLVDPQPAAILQAASSDDVAAGIDDFVNVRNNNYELNEQLLKKAGVL